MNKRVIYFLVPLLFAVVAYGQQNYCADSSYRIRYIFDAQGATLYNNPDTSGKNIFTGSFNGGLALMKTTWGDSILWAKKILLNGGSFNSFKAPDGSIICTGNWGGPVSNNPELLISKIDTNGIVKWMKRLKLSSNHRYYAAGNITTKNILVANNAIYFNAVFYFSPLQTYGYFNVVGKLDIDGNIIWSKGFRVILPRIGTIVDAPVFYNNSIVFATPIFETSGSFATDAYTGLTKLNDADGSVMENDAYRTMTDTLVKGIKTALININPDNSLSLTGTMSIKHPLFGIVNSHFVFNTRIDSNLNPVHNFYYKDNVPFDSQGSYFDFNNQKQHAYLTQDSYNHNDKYFITFDNDDNISRSRKFTIPSFLSGIYGSSVNLDDKQNLHFLFHYPQSGKQITEYARISNFAPDGTLGCFGKDTSILTTYPFGLTKAPFTWDNVQSDVIVANDVPYTEDTAIVTKELVCKIVSLCNSVKINGPAKACINQPVRYTITRNTGCFKNSDWVIDTSFADIINTEGDSAITISFKKPFAGYVHAALTDCVVKDSFFVTAAVQPVVKLLNRDSLLCPGKTLVLKAAPGFVSYQWQDGSAADSIIVSSPGFYKVTTTDVCGFLSADSIVVNYPDTVLPVPPTQTICKYDTAYIVLPDDVNNITWQPTSNTLLNNKTLWLYPIQSTVYTISAERLANCPVSKTTQVVIKICPQLVFIPTAFTPNGDGLNDVFRATPVRPLQYFHLLIYNRYGQKIFETSTPSTGWDGSFKGSRQQTGGYMYQCSYRFTGGQQQNVSGYFILVR